MKLSARQRPGNFEHPDRDGINEISSPPLQPPEPRGNAGPIPSRASLRGLDWFTFFIADVQTGFGPFIAVYLTTQKWTQVDIGLVLTISGLVALACQMPGGAILDAARSERFAASVSVATIGASALMIGLWPIFPVVLAAEVLHAAASCVLGPAIVAISLGLVGHAMVGERLGRNARFASIGSGLAAAAMGACGYLLSSRAVFFVTAALAIPALIALARIRVPEIDPVRAHGGTPKPPSDTVVSGLRTLAHNRTLLVLCGCVLLFHLTNAAILPLLGSALTMRSPESATILIAACIVVPQLVVAGFAPWVGRQAQRLGRKPLLLIGFLALPIRAALFAVISDPYTLIAVQLLDGICASVLGVLVPLIIADATRNTGRFNLGQGIVGSAVGIGASLSMTGAGYIADNLGSSAAFLALSALGCVSFVLVFLFMPETLDRKIVMHGRGDKMHEASQR
jgi:MFS family permease